MEDPATRRPAYGPEHRASSQRRRGSTGRGSSRLGLSAAVAVPTAVLVVAAAVVAGGATAAMRGGQHWFGGQSRNAAQGMSPAQVAQARMQPMIAPKLRGKAAKRAAAQAAAPAAAQAAAAAAQVNANCTLIVPPNPLTAQGLSTPYQLVATDPAAGPCNEANANQSAFVQGAILSPAGQLTLYDPLVIDQGTQPIVPPTPAQVPPGSTVGVWFGFNGDNLTLASTQGTNSLQQGNCVNGLQGSIFGQFAACNAPAWFQAANAAVQANMLQIPPLGTAADGLPCPTVRDYSVVDQDQSDNVNSNYLAAANGQTGQANAATRAALQQQGQNNPPNLANGSDNRLLNVFINPTLGCQSWTRPNGAQDGQATPSLPLNELQAAALQQAPVAEVPLNDPMAQVNGNNSPQKVNLFRANVDQMPIRAADNGDGANYCNTLFNTPAGIARVFNAQAIFANGASPDPAAANNLFTFLAMRAQGAFENLNCGALLGQANPITLTMNNGVVTAATLAPAAPAAAAAAANNANANAAAANGANAAAAANGAAANGAAANGAAANGAAANGAAAAATPTATATSTRHKKHHHHHP